MTAEDIGLIVYGAVGIIVGFVVAVQAEVDERRRARTARAAGGYPSVLPGDSPAEAVVCGLLWPVGLLIAAGVVAYMPVRLIASMIDGRDARTAQRQVDAARIAEMERELLDKEER